MENTTGLKLKDIKDYIKNTQQRAWQRSKYGESKVCNTLEKKYFRGGKL